MRFIFVLALILKVYSQVQETTSVFSSIIPTQNDWKISAATQIYNTDLIAFTDHSSSDHQGHFKIYDINTKSFKGSFVNLNTSGAAVSSYYLVNLPNSNYVSVQVEHGHTYYVKTFDLQLNTISIISQKESNIFYPGNNGNNILIPEGNILEFYNVVTGENYQQIASPILSNIIWACESANYYIIAIGTELEFYELQTLTKNKAFTFNSYTPMQVKPYHMIKETTFIPTINLYASWQSGNDNYITIIKTDDLSYQQIYFGSNSFLNCAPGNANNLELICANDKMIHYIQNNTVLKSVDDIEHFPHNKLTFTTNSTYYSNGYSSIVYYSFTDGSL